MRKPQALFTGKFSISNIRCLPVCRIIAGDAAVFACPFPNRAFSAFFCNMRFSGFIRTIHHLTSGSTEQKNHSRQRRRGFYCSSCNKQLNAAHQTILTVDFPQAVHRPPVRRVPRELPERVPAGTVS